MSKSTIKDKLRLEAFTNVNFLPILALVVIASVCIGIFYTLRKHFKNDTRPTEFSSLDVDGSTVGGAVEPPQSVKSDDDVPVPTESDFIFKAPEETPQDSRQ